VNPHIISEMNILLNIGNLNVATVVIVVVALASKIQWPTQTHVGISVMIVVTVCF
ncbi:unnamed protein product, partial [marine sediment metagenome]